MLTAHYSPARKSLFKLFFIFLSVIWIFSSCSGNKTENKGTEGLLSSDTITGASVPEPNSVKGDFNGDGKAEYAWLEPFELDSIGNCGLHCSCLIKFSDKSLPVIDLGPDLYSGRLVNEGDLNDNKTDELSSVTSGESGEWMRYKVHSFKNGAWTNLVKSFSVFGYTPNYKYVERIPGKKNLLILRSDYHSEKGPEEKTDTVTIE